MSFSFEEITDHAQAFFDILPPDWQEGIVPYWSEYKKSAQIMVLKKNGTILGGGIIFSSISPDTKIYADLAQSWFDRGCLYIGFLWIDEQFRNQKLGTKWLEEVFKLNLNQKYWLTIEEENLIRFYTQNQFRLIQKIELPEINEWLMAKDLP
jgi:GNAT superfamily N-acetyltransferase